MKRLIFGCLLCLVAMVIPPLVTVALFSHSLPVARGLLPGRMELKLEESAKYTVWNDYVCEYDSKQYKLDKKLPVDWKFLITGPDGGSLTIHAPENKDDNAGKRMSSIKEAYFKTSAAGSYVLNASGSGEKRPFSVRPDISSTMEKIFLPMFIVSLVLGLAGFASVMWGGYDLVMTYSRERREKAGLN